MTPHLPVTDTYAEAFQAFQASGLFARLAEKYRLRPFYERFRPVRLTASVSSVVLNLCSIATAFSAVFAVLDRMVPAAAAAVAAVVLLVLLEAAKRQLAPMAAKNWFQFRKLPTGLVGLVLCLVSASAYLSWSGAADAVRLAGKLTPQPGQTWTNVQANVQAVQPGQTWTNVQANVQAGDPYLDQLKALEKDKALVEKQTWKGKLTREAARQLTGLQAQEAAVREAMRKTAEDRRKALKDSELRTEIQAGKFAAAALLLDLLLLLCLVWLEYYDYRSLAEFCAPVQAEKNDLVQPGQTWTNVQANVQAGQAVQPGQTWTNVQANVQAVQAKKTAFCPVCGRGFEQKTSWQKFCGKDCRLAFHAGRHDGKAFNPALYKVAAGKVNGSSVTA